MSEPTKRRYKDFEDFLSDKFFAENPTTLDDEWPDEFSEWLDDQHSDTLVKYADQYAEGLREREKRLAAACKLALEVLEYAEPRNVKTEAVLRAALSEGGV